MNKISYKTYLNDRLKQVDFHGQLTHPLYVQVTFERKTIFFKSYYFELFSKARYLLDIPPLKPKGPELKDVIAKENEVIDFIIEKHKDDFSLEIFKKDYTYFSQDLCDITESGFLDYMYTFFWDEGMPFMGDLVKWGGKNVVAYDLAGDLKRSFNNVLYEKLVENSFYYSPPYLPLYGFMKETKRWPLLCLTAMEWDNMETVRAFKEYVELHYPKLKSAILIEQVNNCRNYLR
ncbi:hypothetical protein ACFFGT_32685 [Mucilaginibacter angelicae]|uniref:Uncharacterized protein n=1 Tax=Mucilaginibacter angelicae TaxID=869718 RepID=A0ABV6LHZ0_9SPHI